MTTRALALGALAASAGWAQAGVPTASPPGAILVGVLVALVLGAAVGRRVERARLARSGEAPAERDGRLALHRPARPANPAELSKLCAATKLRFVQADDGACLFKFEAEHAPSAPVVVVKLNSGGKWVAIYATVLEDVGSPSPALLRRLMDLNEQLWQGKFSLTSQGHIDFQFECPTRTLDYVELRECVTACARTVDERYPELNDLH